MKRTILFTIIAVFCFVNIALATDADRQISEYVSTGDRTAIKTSSGEVFGLIMTATSDGGWIALYDSATSAIDGDEPKVEVQEATANNTCVKDFPEGLNFYDGIYLERSNARTVVYYY